ncbi:MAG: MarR family winged helix-turn-helix transcriptional regulator [Hyphomicrobiaceae bacterium]
MNVMAPTPAKPATTAEQPTIADIAAATAETCIATRVRQLSRIVTRVYDDAMRPHGITASQYTLLTQLAQRDGITAVEIGFALDIEKSTLSRNLKRLLALQLIIMDPPAGRKGRGLHLTPKGQAVIKEAFPVWREAQMRATQVMGQNSRETLDGLLHQAEKLAAA